MPLVDPPLSNARTDDLIRFTLPDRPGSIDWSSVFGNTHPVELEIGTGRGRFLMLAAHAHPEVNYIGVEYAKRYLADAIDRIGKRGARNVRLVHAEALTFLRQRVADRTMTALHVYFPDPWPKKRHNKRRLFRPEVLVELARVTAPGGTLRIATDHPDYAAWIERELTMQTAFERLSIAEDDPFWDLPGMGPHTEEGVTNFQIKYQREGRPIHRFWLARRADETAPTSKRRA